MKEQKKRRIFLWALVIAGAGIIFFFSAMDGTSSMKMSNGFTYLFMRLFHPDYDELTPEQQYALYKLFVFIVRKTAHFIEFTALGASLMLLIHEYGLRRSMFWAWLIGTLYAASDELHQYLIGTRTPSLRDVGIDSAGVLFGVLLIALIFRRIVRIRKEE